MSQRRIADRAAEANSVAFNRAIARVDWMKEPWLLLTAPPQSINSLDVTHNVMGSVYSVGPTHIGVESLTEQYARRYAANRGSWKWDGFARYFSNVPRIPRRVFHRCSTLTRTVDSNAVTFALQGGG